MNQALNKDSSPFLKKIALPLSLKRFGDAPLMPENKFSGKKLKGKNKKPSARWKSTPHGRPLQ